ncbi:MAG: N-acetylneuraminate synthase family protein, partial [Chloroflexi bacterium]|nr:N-acetylneuraminate synthase family protein [Chloroflexota bacterium]
IALGAQSVEKHFTTDRTLPGPDQSASLEPDEFRILVTEGRKAFLALRDVGDGVQPAEVGVRQMAGQPQN